MPAETKGRRWRHRRSHRRTRQWVLLTLMCLLTAASAQGAPSGSAVAPRAAAIENLLIQRFIQDRIALQQTVHREHVVTRKNGHTDGRTLRVWYVNGRQVSETVALDNRKLSEQELRAEHARAMQRAREAAERPVPKPGYLEFEGKRYPFERLAHDYVYGPARAGVWNGRKVWIYPARPNPEQTSRSRAETLLLKSAGEVWVDAEDLHVVRILMHTTEPVRYGLGIIADVHSADLALSLARYAPGVWLPESANFQMDATILLFKSLKQSKQQHFYDYHAASGAASPHG